MTVRRCRALRRPSALPSLPRPARPGPGGMAARIAAYASPWRRVVPVPAAPRLRRRATRAWRPPSTRTWSGGRARWPGGPAGQLRRSSSSKSSQWWLPRGRRRRAERAPIWPRTRSAAVRVPVTFLSVLHENCTQPQYPARRAPHVVRHGEAPSRRSSSRVVVMRTGRSSPWSSGTGVAVRAGFTEARAPAQRGTEHAAQTRLTDVT